jgi:hypothetical protein
MTNKTLYTQDVEIKSPDEKAIDMEDGMNMPEPMLWSTITEFNEWDHHATENEACAYQRGFRIAIGLDPVTGTPN